MTAVRGWTLAALFWAVVLLVGPVALQLYLEKPWYAGEVTMRLKERPGPFAGPVDVTELIADLFPAGMPMASARDVLASNGFDCLAGSSDREAARLTCHRRYSKLVCSDTWTVSLQADDDRLASSPQASAHAMCL